MLTFQLITSKATTRLYRHRACCLLFFFLRHYTDELQHLHCTNKISSQIISQRMIPLPDNTAFLRSSPFGISFCTLLGETQMIPLFSFGIFEDSYPRMWFWGHSVCCFLCNNSIKNQSCSILLPEQRSWCAHPPSFLRRQAVLEWSTLQKVVSVGVSMISSSSPASNRS